MDEWNLLRFGWSRANGFFFYVSGVFVVAAVALAIIAGVLARVVPRWFSRYRVVEADISLGRVGHVKLQPNTKDVQIAHQIWTELVTRKAAIPIDPDRDVITKVYDSWYRLFQRVRALISEIPADLIRRDASTRELIRIATQTLNEGLRPHLTRWQAEFRNWIKQREGELRDKSPQELQKTFPQFQALISDMRVVNQGLMEYATALEKIARG